MGFAVIHIGKGTAGKAGGLGNHIDRSKHVPNADPELRHCNKRIHTERNATYWTETKHEINLQKRINNRIQEGYKGKKAIRKDAVTHLNVVMTGSHEDMIRLVKEKTLDEWARVNYWFACDRFGKDNIVEFTMHLDERTPHIHCVVVPLTSDGRLSAKEVMGNREKMTDLQEQYGKEMQGYNLQRGIKGSQATHDSVKEYYARINERLSYAPYRFTELSVKNIPRIEKPPLTGREKWQEAQNEAISSTFRRLEGALLDEFNKYAGKQLKTALTERLQAEEKASRLRKENAQLRGVIRDHERELLPEKKQEINRQKSQGFSR